MVDDQVDFLDETVDTEKATIDPQLIIDVDGFEGPLDLLLTLARSQKVDLTRISILALVEQYLAFVSNARAMRLELAADYLVMAAWLAYLKSRLLIPEQKEEDELSGEELAAALAFRLRRLEAMRDAAGKLIARNQLGRDVFARGAPETISTIRRGMWDTSSYELLSAYATQRQRQAVTAHTVKRRNVWSLQEARDILNRLVGEIADWTPINSFLQDYLMTAEERATILASSLSASLEMVREGKLEVRQAGAFAPIYIRSRASLVADQAKASADIARPSHAGSHEND